MRIGETKLVAPGYPTPFGDSQYEVGQYAPSDTSLSSVRLLEAKDLGLFFDPSIDIYNDEGNIAEEKVKRLNKQSLVSFFAESVEEEVPYYALLNVRAVLRHFNEGFFSFAKFFKITWHERTEIEDIRKQDLVILKLDEDEDKTYLRLYQPYYIYITVPVVRQIVGVFQGFSVASLATAQAYATFIFKKMIKLYPEKIEEFLLLRGWSKEPSEHSIESGKRFFLPSKGYYHRDDNERYTVGSVLSPKDDFVDSLVFYYFHREYLQQFPNVYKYFNSLDAFVSKMR